MVDVEYIRKLHKVKGWSVRRIARELGYSRNTVSKYVEAEDPTPRYRLRSPRPRPVLGPFEAVIRQWLEGDKQRPPKQRHTAHRIYQRLREEYGFTGSESNVRAFVRILRGPKVEACLPLEYAWGEQAQCDFGEADICLRGMQVRVHVFCMRLMAGGMCFVMVFPHEKSEAFYEGHRRAFEFFGGVPREVLYDNPRVLVHQVLGGRERVEQPGFVALRTHYLFDSVFCIPGEKGAHEKGGVENLVGYARRNFLVPLPAVEDLDELNEVLRARCLAEGQRRLPGEQGTLADRWTKEREHLLPLPERPFDCCRTVLAKVNSLQLVTFERCRYSVPTAYVGRTVTVRAYVDQLEIGCGEEVIARHRRLYAPGEESLQVEHYLDLLDKKPGAVANARVFRHLPAPYQAFRERCLAMRPPAPREFVDVLKLHREFPQEVVAGAVAEAVERGVIRADAVRQICLRKIQPETPAPLAEVPAMTAPTADPRRYDALLAAGGMAR